MPFRSEIGNLKLKACSNGVAALSGFACYYISCNLVFLWFYCIRGFPFFGRLSYLEAFNFQLIGAFF